MFLWQKCCRHVLVIDSRLACDSGVWSVGVLERLYMCVTLMPPPSPSVKYPTGKELDAGSLVAVHFNPLVMCTKVHLPDMRLDSHRPCCHCYNETIWSAQCGGGLWLHFLLTLLILRLFCTPTCAVRSCHISLSSLQTCLDSHDGRKHATLA